MLTPNEASCVHLQAELKDQHRSCAKKYPQGNGVKDHVHAQAQSFKYGNNIRNIYKLPYRSHKMFKFSRTGLGHSPFGLENDKICSQLCQQSLIKISEMQVTHANFDCRHQMAWCEILTKMSENQRIMIENHKMLLKIQEKFKYDTSQALTESATSKSSQDWLDWFHIEKKKKRNPKAHVPDKYSDIKHDFGLRGIPADSLESTLEDVKTTFEQQDNLLAAWNGINEEQEYCRNSKERTIGKFSCNSSLKLNEGYMQVPKSGGLKKENYESDSIDSFDETSILLYSTLDGYNEYSTNLNTSRESPQKEKWSSNSPSTVESKKKRKKKPKDMPKRPLSAYNIFFKDERCRILSELGFANYEEKHLECGKPSEYPKGQRKVPHGKITFEQLAQIIGKRWKRISQEEQEVYKRLAQRDMQRYRKQIELYKDAMDKKCGSSKNDNEAATVDSESSSALRFA